MVLCPSCQQKTPLKVEKVFDDHFNLIGEKKLCSFCKFEFQGEDIPIIHQKSQSIFDPHAERNICQYCKSYVMNPWTQKCTLWNREVTATDTCEKFERKKPLTIT